MADVPEPTQAKFQWPPKAMGDAGTSLETQPARSVGAQQVRLANRPTPGWLRELEAAWLGTVRLPWGDRVRDAGWAPDMVGTWCPSCGRGVGAYGLIPSPAPRPSACAACVEEIRDHPVPWSRLVRLGAYAGLLRDGVLEVKRASDRALAQAMGAEMGLQIARQLALTPQDAPRTCAIVPMPTSFLRRMGRGMDHTLALARGMRSATGWPIAPLLARAHRPHQTGQSLRVREKNVARSMRARATAPEPAQFAGVTLLLVDDVMTSGATMREGCRALRAWWQEAPPETGARLDVWACPLAVVDPDRDPHAAPPGV